MHTLHWAKYLHGHVYRATDAYKRPPNRAVIEREDSLWQIEIWEQETSSWIVHDTTYNDLDVAKAVAEALVAMLVPQD